LIHLDFRTATVRPPKHKNVLCFCAFLWPIMQKWFSAFPGEWPGVGLLLLRVLVAVSVIVQTIAYVVATQLSVTGWVFAVLIFASAACLLVGFVTPVAAA